MLFVDLQFRAMYLNVPLLFMFLVALSSSQVYNYQPYTAVTSSPPPTTTNNLSANDQTVQSPNETSLEKNTESSVNKTGSNETEDLYQLFKQLKDFKTWMKDPYMHALVLPSVVGVSAALITVGLLCCINSCIKSVAKRRRKRRIRHLVNDLKTDRTQLLGGDNESDDEF